MTLLPPPNGLTDATVDTLLYQVQQHAGQEGYAVVKQRSKPDKYGVVRKIWLRCDRGGKLRDRHGNRRIHGTSRLNECPFKAVMRRNGSEWVLEVEDGSHNHSATLQVAHPSLRRLALTPDTKQAIVTQTKGHMTPGQII